ncbi:DUF3099 domain-containing [Micractinium conductrix]|uniref:DUF3099 domain-containing n=1 Tax=Micractinium conductrix TaxID=554055 RepID=A0A2P6VQE9_9CHLO|nr:DUF3099 domain-containing [Micractinium conductrix]|eukprot:PSC76312.1 DUF3099 domain-containing [Micractinium conductrix]
MGSTEQQGAAGPAQATQEQKDSAQPQEQQQAKRQQRPRSLREHIMGLEPVTDRMLRWLPEWVRDVAQDRRRQLLYVERQIQRKLVNEFRAQARELAPVLHARGRMVGDILVEAVTGEGDGTEVKYADIVEATLPDVVTDLLPVREVVETLDPLLVPFISPFVEGLQVPINAKAQEVRTTVVQSFAATAAASLATGLLVGYLLGRASGGGGRGGGDDGSGGGGGRR